MSMNQKEHILVSMYVNGNTTIYFNSFRVKQIPEEMKTFISDKNIIANIWRVQAYDSIMWTMTDFTKLFLPHIFRKNDKVIHSELFFKIKNKHEWNTRV